MSTCREAVLDAFERLERRHARRDFELSAIVAEVLAVTTSYEESTIRTHITSRMCVTSPDHHHTTFADLERIGRGVYQRRRASA